MKLLTECFAHVECPSRSKKGLKDKENSHSYRTQVSSLKLSFQT